MRKQRSCDWSKLAMIIDEKKEITLDSLVGIHYLTAVEMTQTKILPYNEEWEDVDSISFEIDGNIFTAVEDPHDGYRSCMKNLILDTARRIANKFSPVKVMVIKKRDGVYHANNALEFIDVLNGKTILEVGTEDSDDYYPSFVARFTPEDVSINGKPYQQLSEKIGRLKWQPIETAPQDGTIFFGINKKCTDNDILKGETEGWLTTPKYPFLCKWVDKTEEDIGCFVEVDVYGHDGNCGTCPDYWMPLPTPPEEMDDE